MGSTSVASRSAVSGLAGGGFRFEIQALRAIAVLAVLVFHIWPDALPGGYVGVDVFFVISGYLITGILFRDLQALGRISIGEFYVRRIRRLLPAAALVLVVVAFLLPLLPQTRWEDTTGGIVASALYVQNWWLAAQAVDYLAAESAPSPVMHFWSLSVEEQYYIFWPLVLLLVGALPSKWLKRPGQVFAGLTLLVVLASLAYSVWLTYENPGVAYFSTLTRAWELGIGGLLAVTVRWQSLSGMARVGLGWLGLAMIGAALVTFDKTTPFPGYTALLPVLGTAMVLAARDSAHPLASYRLLRLRPLQYLGDISYSLYLWHWPVIIFYTAVAGRAPGLVDGVALLAVSCALAHQSKHLVEDTFRHGAPGGGRVVRASAIAAGCIAVTVAAAWAAPKAWLSDDAIASPDVLANSAPVSKNPGAAVLIDGKVVKQAPLLPAPDAAVADVPAPYRSRCMSRGNNTSVKVCSYGNKDSDTRVVLVGDTYAAQWQPALDEVGRLNEWDVRVVVKTGCALGDVTPLDAKGNVFDACVRWRTDMAAKLIEWKPDLVLIAQAPTNKILEASSGKDRAEKLGKGIASFVSTMAEADIPTALIRSTPTIDRECLAAATIRTCARPRSRAVRKLDPILFASGDRDSSMLLDLTDAICTSQECGAVVGNVVVYRGAAHLTATYSRTLSPSFGRALESTGALQQVKIPSADSLPAPSDLPQRATAAKRDNPDLYADGCHADQVSAEPTFCTYGTPGSDVRIVLVGDSHAAQWLPPLQEIAARKDWELLSFTKSACAFSDTVVQVGGREYKSCTEWNENLMSKLAELGPSVVVTSQSRGHRAFGHEESEASQAALAKGLQSRWAELRRMGNSVVVIADTPWMKKDVPDCLSSPRADIQACNTPLEVAVRSPDSILAAARRSPDVKLVTLNELICSDGICPAMKDDMILWRDRHHLTASYARGFVPRIEPVVSAAASSRN